jgi:signal transduction histidine kinase
MSGVISTLLDISRDGAASTVHRTTDPAEVLADAAARAVSRTGITVEVRPGRSAARIAAPSEVVVRALLPIVDNAVQHASSVVVLEAVERPDRIDLVVSDDGQGIEPPRRARLFDPGVSHRAGGAGLGLGIARRVARSLGGEVTLEDSPRGARFVVSLPRR